MVPDFTGGGELQMQCRCQSVEPRNTLLFNSLQSMRVKGVRALYVSYYYDIAHNATIYYTIRLYVIL